MKSDKIRVLHIVSHLDHGGLEQVVASLVERVDRERFEGSVLCLSGLGTVARRLGVGERVFMAPRQSRLSLLNPVVLQAEIERLRPDVVHCHSGVWLKGAMASRSAGGVTVIYTEHGRRRPDPLYARKQDGFAALHTRVVVAVTPGLKTYLESEVVPPGSRVEVIENGTDTEHFRPDSAARRSFRESLQLGPDVLVVGTLGRLVPVKGMEIMVRAIAMLTRELGVPAHLVVAGDGDERSALDMLVSDLGVGTDVSFLGWRSDTRMILPGFDIFAMTSRSEGTSIGLLEAMSTGVCPVVTDVGGNARVLGPALGRCLVPVDDVRRVAAGWALFARDAALRNHHASLARSRVVHHYSVDTMIREYERLYAEGCRRSETPRIT